MVFQSAVYKIKGHPGTEIYKSKGRWIIREAGYGQTTPPQWLQTLINASQQTQVPGWATREDLIDALEMAYQWREQATPAALKDAL